MAIRAILWDIDDTLLENDAIVNQSGLDNVRINYV